MKQARQLIVHKKVFVDGRVVSIPSYTVPVELENKITLKEKKQSKKKEKKVEGEEKE
jgi:ribosomal protein S4